MAGVQPSLCLMSAQCADLTAASLLDEPDRELVVRRALHFEDRLLARVGRRAQVLSLGYRELFLEHAGVDPFGAGEAQLRAALGDVGVDGTGLSRDDWLDLVMTHRIQPRFPADRITVVHDWPASQCALARIRAGEPPVAERFELYLGQFELANGYHELADAAEQRRRFELDQRRRAGRGAIQPPVDERLLAALAAGMPDCAGVALGVERLLMALSGTSRIADVLAFDFLRA